MSASPWRPLGVPLSSWWISAFVRGSRAAPADSGVGLVTKWSLASSQRVRAGVCSTHHPLSHQTDLEAPAEQKQDMLHMSAHNHQAPPECTRAEQRGSATAGSRGGRSAERHGPQAAILPWQDGPTCRYFWGGVFLTFPPGNPPYCQTRPDAARHSTA